jgi:uncharacterized membrane-anchored protein YhcB (DUF1043 family)
MGWELTPYLVPLFALAVGVVIGRLTGRRAARVRELGAQVETLNKESERAAGELAAAKAEIGRRRKELEDYRTRVSDHFAGTSERFRDLSLRYRALFDHLSEGARGLCPDGFPALEGGPEAKALPAEPEAAGGDQPPSASFPPPFEPSPPSGGRE